VGLAARWRRRRKRSAWGWGKAVAAGRCPRWGSWERDAAAWWAMALRAAGPRRQAVGGAGWAEARAGLR
jgi:hypothetical protein